MTVNKDTLLGGSSALKNVTYDSSTQSTAGNALSALPSLYVLNVIDFSTLSSNTVTFGFSFVEPHQKLIVRARALSECNPSNGQNNTFQMTLSGPSNAVVNPPLTLNADTVVEA